MKVRYHHVIKQDVKYIKYDTSVKDAYGYLTKTGFRSVPVLKDNGKTFIGLIYKVNLLEHYHENNGKDDDSINSMIKDKDAYIFEEDSFFKTFLSIRRLPFLGVVNEQKEFCGIITHSNVMDVLEDSFGMKTGGYLLTVATKEHKGALKDLVSAVKNVNIEGLLTLDNGDRYIRRIIVNLSKETPEKELQKIIKRLEEKDLRVTSVEQVKNQ